MVETAGADRRRGRAVVIVGPDGAGKSALADVLVGRLEERGRVLRFHHRAPILPRRTRSEIPVTEPHKRPPYGTAVSTIKLAWLFVDMQLMWRLVVPRALRQGSHVIVERGWWDLVVDPRRYRLRPSPLIRRLARYLPPPDLEVVLTGPSEELYARKPELPPAEIERQSRAWRMLRPAGPHVVHLDATRPIEALVDATIGRLDEASVGAGRPADSRGWARLPPGSQRPRWYVPRSPRRVARASLSVYQPVTRRGAVGWKAARLVAGLGGLRLLPAHPAPDELAIAARALPRDAVCAVAMGRHPNRASLLAVDADGRPVAVIKVAIDEAGRRRLAHEADRGERLRSALSHPLSSPRLLDQGPGYVVFEAVPWVARARAWELPEEVARAMGCFHAAGRQPGRAGGHTHGDFAPWNLMRTPAGWSLVDWADAELDGPPFQDVLHYLVQAHALLGRPRLPALVEGLHGRGPIGQALRAYAAGAGLPAAEALERLPAYLDTSERALSPGADQARGRAARANLRLAIANDPR